MSFLGEGVWLKGTWGRGVKNVHFHPSFAPPADFSTAAFVLLLSLALVFWWHYQLLHVLLLFFASGALSPLKMCYAIGTCKSIKKLTKECMLRNLINSKADFYPKGTCSDYIVLINFLTVYI